MTGDRDMAPNEEMLHGWVDGQVDAAGAAAVEAARERDPDLRARLDAWVRQSRALSSAHAGVIEEPVPARICVQRMAEKRAARSGLLRTAASLILVAMVAGAGGWYARDILDAPPTVADISLAGHALSAHQIYTVEVRHAVEVAASEEDHLARWLSKRLGRELRIPDLAGVGFALVGGRLLPDEGLAAAQFMYEDETGLRLTLYVTTNAPGEETAFRTVEQGPVRAFYWRDRDLGYALVGEIARPRLLRMARMVYSELEGTGK